LQIKLAVAKQISRIIKVDDHDAMVLSFTENFERADFTPVEEARFFYNALGIKGDFQLKVSQDSP